MLPSEKQTNKSFKKNCRTKNHPTNSRHLVCLFHYLFHLFLLFIHSTKIKLILNKFLVSSMEANIITLPLVGLFHQLIQQSLNNQGLSFCMLSLTAFKINRLASLNLLLEMSHRMDSTDASLYLEIEYTIEFEFKE